jgi:signal transduction histidine kinase
MAELFPRLARFGWLVLLLAVVAIQAYLTYPALAFSLVLDGNTLAVPVLSLIIASMMERRARRVEEARAELGRRLSGAEWERDTLLAALESSPGAIAVVANSFRPFLDNRRFGEWFGVLGAGHRDLPPDESIRRLAARVVDAESFRRWIAQLRENPERIDRLPVQLLDGPIRALDCRTAPVRATNGVILGRLFSYRDVSRASEDARAKRKLVSTVSHELRTPLASVVGLAELLLLRAHSKAERQQYLRVILEETHRLTSIIDEFLNLHRVRTEPPDMRRDSPYRSESKVVGGRS